MGLDAYLYRRSYVRNWDYMKLGDRHKVTVKKGGVTRRDIRPERVSHITEEVAYWRKFNALHRWIIETAGVDDDGREVYLSPSLLKELFTALDVVASNPQRAGETLPTHSGPFFGGMEYDDHYYSEVERTRVIIQRAIEEGGEYFYEASW